MILDSIGKIIFFFIILFSISSIVVAIKQINSGESKPSTILGLFVFLCLSIIILLFLIFDINKLHIIWILILVYLLSLTKYAFRIGIILFNLMCLILKKQNVVNDKDNILFPDSASNQKDAEAYSNRGNSKVELEDYRGAIQDYNKAIKINPNYAEPYSNRGNSKGELEDYGGAIQDYNKAIKINPNYAKAYITRGNAKYILGDKESACSDWAKAAKLGITQASELIKEYCK